MVFPSGASGKELSCQCRWHKRHKWSEVKVTQLCLTFCDPMNYTVHGILQARILEWVALKRGLIPRSGRSPGRGHGNPFQYYCLENPMARGAWQATVHGVAKSPTQLKQFSMHEHSLCIGVTHFKNISNRSMTKAIIL